MRVFLKMPPGGLQNRKGGGDGVKIKLELSEVDTRAVSRKQKELIGKFKMVASDAIIRGQVMEYTYIPTGIKRKFVWIVTGRGKFSGLLEEDLWSFMCDCVLQKPSRQWHRHSLRRRPTSRVCPE